MSQELNNSSPGIRAQVGAVLLLIFVSALIGFVALSVVTGNDFGVGATSGLLNPQPDEAAPSPLETPNPLGMVSFKQTALGFNLQYPRNWRKREQGLQVILSPSAGGLDPANLQDTALLFGIPVNSATNPAQLLARLQSEMFPSAQTLDTGSRRIGGESWQMAEISFESEALGPMTAMVATTSKNEVDYFAVAAAPAGQWAAFQPVVNNVFNSFQFTTQAVLRPADATPPPTPTPTPTPVFYIIKSGDTLSHVSVKYDVSIEAIMDRNGLDESSMLHPGDKLLIPRPRRR